MWPRSYVRKFDCVPNFAPAHAEQRTHPLAISPRQMAQVKPSMWNVSTVWTAGDTSMSTMLSDDTTLAVRLLWPKWRAASLSTTDAAEHAQRWHWWWLWC